MNIFKLRYREKYISLNFEKMPRTVAIIHTFNFVFTSTMKIRNYISKKANRNLFKKTSDRTYKEDSLTAISVLFIFLIFFFGETYEV